LIPALKGGQKLFLMEAMRTADGPKEIDSDWFISCRGRLRTRSEIEEDEGQISE
jgi:hypothetical protein